MGHDKNYEFLCSCENYARIIIFVSRLSAYYFSHNLYFPQLAILLIQYPMTHIGFLYWSTNSFHTYAYRGKIPGGLPQIHTVSTVEIGWQL